MTTPPPTRAGTPTTSATGTSISLNVECNSAAFNNDCSTTDGGLLAQETQWLANDLKRNHAPCTLAYWHQPTFSATTASTATVPASAPGAGGQEGGVADAWWQLLYDNHATLVLNGHEHAYARLRPMDPAGNYDPKHGIPEIIVGTGGEALDTLAVSNGVYANPNVVTAYDQGYGVMNLTLKPNGYSFDVQAGYWPAPGSARPRWTTATPARAAATADHSAVGEGPVLTRPGPLASINGPQQCTRIRLYRSRASVRGTGGRGVRPGLPFECCQRPECGPRRPGRTCVPSALTAVSSAGSSPRRERIVGATWVVSTEVDST